MAYDQFEWTVLGYYRYPIVCKMVITNTVSGMASLILDFARWPENKIRTIVVQRNKKVIFSITRTKAGWRNKTS